MALKIKQPGILPLGQFDGLDSEYASFKGGEVVTFEYVSVSGADKAAKDVSDGYTSLSDLKRPAVTANLNSGKRPLFLADDGTSGYGTLFGTVVGGVAGADATGTVVGPHTALGSGKVTLWDKPGLYAVTLDAVDTNAATGLQPTNTTLVGGAPLFATEKGLLTPNVAESFEVNEELASSGLVVARFVEFETNRSKVTTPASLAGALSAGFVQAVIWFLPQTATYVSLPAPLE